MGCAVCINHACMFLLGSCFLCFLCMVSVDKKLTQVLAAAAGGGAERNLAFEMRTGRTRSQDLPGGLWGVLLSRSI